MTGDTSPPEEQVEAAVEMESGPDLLKFLQENRPKEDAEELDPEKIKLTRPLRIELAQYEKLLDNLPETLSLDSKDTLLARYAHKLEKTLQDPRDYVDLCNRAYAFNRLEEEILATIPYEGEYTRDDFDRVYRLDLDLDEFKPFNEYYGHGAGNKILETLSDILNGGESIQWLRDQGVLEERDENQPSPVVFNAESAGDEFGGMVIFKRGLPEARREEVIQEFVARLEKEAITRFKEVLSATDDKDKPKFPFDTSKLPTGMESELPEDFVMESGVSIGYASVKDAAQQIEWDPEKEGFEVVISKMRNLLLEISDKRSRDNKAVKKQANINAPEGSNAKLTARISPRGEAEVHREDLDWAKQKLELVHLRLTEFSQVVQDLMETRKDDEGFQQNMQLVKANLDSLMEISETKF